jgi:poly-gamma-glutamate synthesis protein (capsule biosynthesis protein)
MAMASYKADISTITSEVKKRMIKGNSWHKGCPVPLNDLRYLQMSYIDFHGRTKQGEMVVHKEVAAEVVHLFEELYEAGYPVRQMRLVSDFGGSDWQSIEADNTSAFNCRHATGSKKWSRHSYGKAIDLNPIENPYISRSGRIAHKASLKYRKRVRQKNMHPSNRAILLKDDAVVRLFKAYGWKWGGDWHGVKDYQHFSK